MATNIANFSSNHSKLTRITKSVMDWLSVYVYIFSLEIAVYNSWAIPAPSCGIMADMAANLNTCLHCLYAQERLQATVPDPKAFYYRGMNT